MSTTARTNSNAGTFLSICWRRLATFRSSSMRSLTKPACSAFVAFSCTTEQHIMLQSHCW